MHPKTPKNPQGAGRPLKHIDKEQFESLCKIQCTQVEVQAFFDCDDVTLNKWCRKTYGVNFSEIFKKKRGLGNISLRRRQFQEAVEKGNITMLIWLGKNRLGQSDKVEFQDAELAHEESDLFKE